MFSEHAKKGHWTWLEVTGCLCILGNYLIAMVASKHMSRKPVPERNTHKSPQTK